MTGLQQEFNRVLPNLQRLWENNDNHYIWWLPYIQTTHTGSYSTTIFELPWLECVCVICFAPMVSELYVWSMCCIYIYVCVPVSIQYYIYTCDINIFELYRLYNVYICVYYLYRYEISVHIHIHASIHTIPYLNIT